MSAPHTAPHEMPRPDEDSASPCLLCAGTGTIAVTDDRIVETHPDRLTMSEILHVSRGQPSHFSTKLARRAIELRDERNALAACLLRTAISGVPRDALTTIIRTLQAADASTTLAAIANAPQFAERDDVDPLVFAILCGHESADVRAKAIALGARRRPAVSDAELDAEADVEANVERSDT